MPDLNNFLEQNYTTAAASRDRHNFEDWADSWQNFVVQNALSDYEFARNKEMWDLMNEYNSPANQMQRFKDAGLNPMLVYSQGTNGNASSQVSYSKPNMTFGLRADDLKEQQIRQAKLNQVLDILNVVNNLSQSVSSMIDSGLDIQLKANQVRQSNFYDQLFSTYLPYGSSDIGRNTMGITDRINPLSPNFDPYEYLTWHKLGGLPSAYNTFFDSLTKRDLWGSQIDFNSFKTAYQKYYNENLLPKFNDYQQGKIDIQEIDKAMKQYDLDVIDMIPPQLRGLVEPLVQYLSPFIKFIFKSSSIKR